MNVKSGPYAELRNSSSSERVDVISSKLFCVNRGGGPMATTRLSDDEPLSEDPESSSSFAGPRVANAFFEGFIGVEHAALNAFHALLLLNQLSNALKCSKRNF